VEASVTIPSRRLGEGGAPDRALAEAECWSSSGGDDGWLQPASGGVLAAIDTEWIIGVANSEPGGLDLREEFDASTVSLCCRSGICLAELAGARGCP
jgi:hypothetical protein